jgi:hypothetical protein
VRVKWLDRFAAAVVYSTLLAAGGIALSTISGPTRDRWLDWASTNLVNLRHHPVSALVVSAFLAEDDRLAWVLLALVSLGATGWALGAWRTATLVGTAHVVGTLVSEGVLWARINAGAVPVAQERTRDVGPSYVVICALVAGLVYAPWIGRALCAIGFVLVAPGSFSGLPHLELATMGHTCALLIAIGFGWVLRRSRRSTRQPAPTES